MCDKCSELDKKIERFKNLAGRISDQQTLMPSLHWLQSKRLKRPRFIPNKKSKAASVGRPLSFHNLILEGNASGSFSSSQVSAASVVAKTLTIRLRPRGELKLRALVRERVRWQRVPMRYEQPSTRSGSLLPKKDAFLVVASHSCVACPGRTSDYPKALGTFVGAFCSRSTDQPSEEDTMQK